MPSDRQYTSDDIVLDFGNFAVGTPLTPDAFPPPLTDLISLDAMEQVLQVAESGHGLAMGRRPVVDSWLERGRLVAPFGEAGPTGAAYYLCRPKELAPTAAGRRLRVRGARAV